MWPSVPPLEVSKSFPKLCNSFCLVRLFAIRRFASGFVCLVADVVFSILFARFLNVLVRWLVWALWPEHNRDYRGSLEVMVFAILGCW